MLVGPPTITTAPEHHTVVRSENATFSCQATGIPTPTISWWKEESGILFEIVQMEGTTVIEEEEDEAGSRHSTLTILSTQISDAGMYVCIAENVVGTDTATAELIVHGEL